MAFFLIFLQDEINLGTRQVFQIGLCQSLPLNLLATSFFCFQKLVSPKALRLSAVTCFLWVDLQGL